jgi:hypothetical protein
MPTYYAYFYVKCCQVSASFPSPKGFPIKRPILLRKKTLIHATKVTLQSQSTNTTNINKLRKSIAILRAIIKKFRNIDMQKINISRVDKCCTIGSLRKPAAYLRSILHNAITIMFRFYCHSCFITNKPFFTSYMISILFFIGR